MNRLSAIIATIIILVILIIIIAFYGLIATIIIHFVSKFW